jgi:hypothetical protein
MNGTKRNMILRKQNLSDQFLNMKINRATKLWPCLFLSGFQLVILITFHDGYYDYYDH